MREDIPAGDLSSLVVVVLLAFVTAFVVVFVVVFDVGFVVAFVVGFVVAFVVAVFFTAFVAYALAGLGHGPVFDSFPGARNRFDWGGSDVRA